MTHLEVFAFGFVLSTNKQNISDHHHVVPPFVLNHEAVVHKAHVAGKRYKMVAEAKPSEAMHSAQSNRGHPQANLLMTMSKLSILLATSGSPIPTDVQNGVSRISVGLPRGSLVCSAEPSASCSSSAILMGCCSKKLLLFASWLKRGYWTGGIGQQAANGADSSCCRARGFSVRGKLASSKGANMALATS